MKSSIARVAFALCLLTAATAPWAAQKPEPSGIGLLNATAIVNAVDVKDGTVELWVHSIKHGLTFQVSAACLYDVGIHNLAGLKPGMHVLVWTQGGQAGTLPVIYRLALQPR